MKISFRWSFIYEQQIHHLEKYDHIKIEKEVKEFIKSLEEDWKKVEKELTSYIEKITGLKFKSKKINCYVVHTSIYMPISDPLTIAINLKSEEETFSLKKERYMDMLIHEIIHNILIENEKETEVYFKNLFSGMYSLNWNVSIHVLVHAIHKEIFFKFFSKNRFDEELEISSYYPEYKEAWDIVLKETSKKIISNFKSFI